MRPDIIIMLTHHDVTVKNAAEVFEECKNIEAVKLWGFKNVVLHGELRPRRHPHRRLPR